jgi:nucleoid DNA-binding protein
MNKKDLVKYVSNKTMITEKDSATIIEVFLKGIKEGLENGERVKLQDFGSFIISERAARVAYDPRNGNKVDVPEKKVVKFVSSKKLFERVN